MTKAGYEVSSGVPTTDQLGRTAEQIYEVLMQRREELLGADNPLLVESFYSPVVSNPNTTLWSPLVQYVTPASDDRPAHIAIFRKRDAESAVSWKRPPLYELTLADPEGRTTFVPAIGRIASRTLLPDSSFVLHEGDDRLIALGKILDRALIRFTSRNVLQYGFRLLRGQKPS